MTIDDNARYEKRMKDTATFNLAVKQAEAKAKGRAGTVHPWNGLVAQMQKAVRDVLKARARKQRGRNLIGVAALREALDARVKLDKIAAVAARTVVDETARGANAQRLSRAVGKRIEDEVRMSEFRRREPALYKRLQRDLKERGSEDYDHKRGVLVDAIARANSEEEWKPWSLRTRAELGLLVLDALMQVGFLTKANSPGDYRKGQQRLVSHFVLTDEVEEALRHADAMGYELVNPWFKPMLVEPRDWTDIANGGYSIFELPLVKTRNAAEVDRLRGADLSLVFDAVNAVQRTPWRINEDVLVTAQELQAQGLPIEGLAERFDLDEPVRPADIPLPPKKGEPKAEMTEDQEARLAAWMQDKRHWHNALTQRKSKNAQAFRTFEIADELRGKTIYFPQQLDYRGRMYSVPLILNPQGNDLSKGLLTFAEERPLGEMGGFWLAVHGANVFGMDKLTLNERADWIFEHEEAIEEVAADPVSNLWWTEADKPWQFLAFCLEWDRVDVEDPESLSSLPVAVDGSCNGLQHFSAMLRDESGAALTNLRRSEAHHDIYREVADATVESAKAQMELSATDREIGGRWLDRGVDRKVVKRPVMTTPYGVTAIGMKQQILDDTVSRDTYDYGPEPWKAAQWLAERIDEVLLDRIGGARQAMQFLQDTATALANEGMPIAWVNPAGFPIFQKILLRSTFVIDTALLGRVKLRYAQQTPKLDRKGQRSKVAPNFVHSYDAAHLMLTVVNAEGEADRRMSWAMVHDSFGTHAGDCELLGQVLREQFVLMYATADPLQAVADAARAELPEGTDIPEPPAKGDFDLNEVLDAEFFFA